nr:outer membrane beta-barrel protein [uncultured Bacteroides sp.]
MKKENDELTELFRSRLADAKMPVRDRFWEELEKDIPVAVHRRRLYIYRFTAAASVLFVLMASSAAFWFFSPKEEIADAFTKVEISAGAQGQLNADVVKDDFPPIHTASVLPKPTPRSFGVLTLPDNNNGEGQNDSTVSITVSMSFSISSSSSYTSRNKKRSQQQQTSMASNSNEATENAVHSHSTDVERSVGGSSQKEANKVSSWALKAAAGLSLLVADDMRAPVAASITLEKKITKRFSVEAGLAYSCEQSPENGNMHYVGIPVKANYLIAGNRKLDVYASLGGLLDKCVAGAPQNDFNSEPIQLSLTAGLGVRYKISDKFALFAEPAITHHFNPDLDWETARSRKSTNMNLLCGVRMTY